MRISGGIVKGRKIKTKSAFKRGRSGELRPTSSKVRQAIFNILQDRINGSSFLDLYAGTGAVGIEALSRGAERVVFVDGDPVRAGIIKKIVEEIGFRDKVSVFKDDALRFLKKSSEAFDIIFADPPYDSGDHDLILHLISDRNVLKDMGILIVEHRSKKFMPEECGSLRHVKTYLYGDTALSLYRKENL